MKKFLGVMLFTLISTATYGQVLVSTFKLGKDEPFGCCPGRKMIKTKFKVTDEKDLKYVKFHYYIVNAVGDVVSGRDYGITQEGREYIKPKTFAITGPMESGKTYVPWASGVIQTNQTVTAIPYQIEIVYMGSDESIFIDINKENYIKYFPKLKWIEYNRWNKAL